MQCVRSGRYICVARDKMCDGRYLCDDWSDEDPWKCQALPGCDRYPIATRDPGIIRLNLSKANVSYHLKQCLYLAEIAVFAAKKLP